jgi:CheY-like chemotaxis protein
MMLQAMVLTRDPETLRVVRRALDDLKIACEPIAGPVQALEMLNKRRFDAVIADCDDLEGALDILKTMRKTPSNKRAMGFAIVNGTTSVRDAFDLGANFVIDKPLTMERVQRSLRAAHGLMMRERRRYFRNTLSSPAFLTAADGRELRGRIINLSEGGMAVKLTTPLTLNSSLRLRFDLPNPLRQIEAKAEVSWIRGDNSAGLRFLHIEQRMQRELEQWIAQQSELFYNSKPSPMFINATRGR